MKRNSFDILDLYNILLSNSTHSVSSIVEQIGYFNHFVSKQVVFKPKT